MANSNIITELKDKIVKLLFEDDVIVKAIDPNYEYDTPDELVNNSIFRYGKNPKTITETCTFITVKVQIPTISDNNTAFVYPLVEIDIISHFEHMKITNIPKVTDTRIDYISKLIDKKLNGVNIAGVGQLYLKSNQEGATENDDYVKRHMLFKTIDLNNSVCNQD